MMAPQLLMASSFLQLTTRCWPSFFNSWVHRSFMKKNPEGKPHPAMRFSSLQLVMCCIFCCIL
uniref:Uncharacterized protein n=1 Tax=Triticum urartu TaxID=4572 RepID=A0A8R7QEI6_TRIUA